MSTEKIIPVCYAGNKKVFEGIMLGALSILKHAKSAVKFYVLTMDLQDVKPEYLPISPEQVAALDEIAKTYNSGSAAQLIDVTPLYLESLKSGRNERTEYTPYCLLRLYMDVLPEIPDKAVYLDVDTMVLRDIDELYSIDIADYEYGAVVDYMGKFWISKYYINSGVLLLNMAEIRRTKLFTRAREMVTTKWMKMADQTAINRLAERKLYLPGKFNEQRNIKPDTVVKHFNKGIRYFPFFHIYNYKQWQREKVHKKLKIHDFDDIYALYDTLDSKYGFKNL